MEFGEARAGEKAFNWTQPGKTRSGGGREQLAVFEPQKAGLNGPERRTALHAAVVGGERRLARSAGDSTALLQVKN